MTPYDSLDRVHSIAVVILAAGASSRMGHHKLLLPIGGKPLIAWSVQAACASLASEVLIILGRDASAVQAALPPHRYRTLVNTEFERGQGSSLSLAASSVAPASNGLVVLLADQPFMDRDSVDRILLAAQRESDRIIMGSVNDHAGHPIYLPQRLFPDIRALSKDRGARDIIAAQQGEILVEPLANELAHFDVDTTEDYQQALTMAYRLGSPNT